VGSVLGRKFVELRMRTGKAVKIILGILLVAFLLIQFIPSEMPESIPGNEDDLMAMDDMDEEIALILRNSCYDCHSNETRFPWYGYVAPARWLVIKDINEGRKELNFSNWNRLEKREQISLLQDMIEEVEDGHMPLPVYTLIHTDAKLNDAEKKKLSEWSEKVMEKIFGE
jgi:hypothetical protein